MIWRKRERINLSELDVFVLRKYAGQTNPMEEILNSEIPENLPPILTPYHLPLFMHNFKKMYYFWENYRDIMKCSNEPREFYRRYDIMKRYGKMRTVYKVSGVLADVQHWILRNILDELPVSRHATAYAKGRKIMDNAAPHVGKKLVVKADITDFFGNVKYLSVYDVFKNAGYSKSVATLLANLCCCDGHIMQGACTSPALSNLCFTKIDSVISEFCTERGITYTRYSDDMTFSGDFAPSELITYLRRVLKFYGFTMNDKKTKVLYRHHRQTVTGAVVNDKPQPTKEYRRRIRQEMYYIRKYGVLGHMDRLKDEKSYVSPINYLENLYGRMNYVLQYTPDDEELKRWMHEVDRIEQSLF
ncbi:MAG: RNA-directed DNA polymerase [Oscillospiraceae bacterium]|nr:RNA-directed DNA polymerase [Oscillospiraceae bacterium]